MASWNGLLVWVLGWCFQAQYLDAFTLSGLIKPITEGTCHAGNGLKPRESIVVDSNTFTGEFAASYAMGLLIKENKSGQLQVRKGMYGFHWIERICSMALKMLTIDYAIEYIYFLCILLWCWGFRGYVNGYVGFINLKSHFLVCYSIRNGILDHVYFGMVEILDWQIHVIILDKIWKNGMELLYAKILHKDKIWVEYFGFHYTHQIGFPKHIKFVFNESTKLEL